MKRRQGFTLVEIVIVVAIIGLLMVVIVPSITSAWKTNNMKAARLQAERVAKSIRVGIVAGDIKTFIGQKATYTEYSSDNVLNIRPNSINYIGGIDTLYEINTTTQTNEDLIDPTSEATEDVDKTMRVAYRAGKIWIMKADDNTVLYQEP